MRIVILGAGAMGSLYGALLSKQNEVHLIDIWKEHIEKINKDGLIIEEKEDIKKYYPKGVTNVSDLKDTDLVIIFVKSIDTLEVVSKYENLFEDNTLVLSLQNGYGNLEDIQKFVKKENIIIGTTSHGATILEPGKIKHGGVGKTILGSVENSSKENINKIKEVFLKCKIETEISDNILHLIWSKLIINIGINPLTAILEVENGKLLESDFTIDTMKKLVYESIDVLKAINIDFDKDEMFEKVKEVARNTARNKSSMLQDILKKRKTEIDKINGAIVSLGKDLNIQTPYNELMVYLIKSIEKLS